MPIADREERNARARERSREWREANPEAAKAYLREWHAANPEYWPRYRAANREKRVAEQRAYKAAYPEKVRAHEAVRRAIKAGRLERGPCECAGDDCRGRIEAHHDDYSKPLDVRWLCKAHHTAVHLDTASQAVLS